jgi:KDO2-lipid IV(A) lauroyltransferase
MALISPQREARLAALLWEFSTRASYQGVRLLPPRIASDMGEWLGRRVAPVLSPDAARTTVESLRRIRPDYTEAECAAAVDRMWGHIGRVQAEMAVIERMWGSASISIRNGECVKRAVASGRPVVFVFPHMGNWELLALVAQHLGARTSSVYEELPHRFQLDLVQRARRRIGHRVISPDREGLIALLGSMRRKEAVGLAIDEFKHGNVIAPAFGRPPRRDTNACLVESLARRFGAMVIPAHCVRTGPLEFVVSVLDPLERPTAADLNTLCESWIRAHPEQWYMLHRLRFDQA